jgi:hypothetical protein
MRTASDRPQSTTRRAPRAAGRGFQRRWMYPYADDAVFPGARLRAYLASSPRKNNPGAWPGVLCWWRHASRLYELASSPKLAVRSVFSHGADSKHQSDLRPSAKPKVSGATIFAVNLYDSLVLVRRASPPLHWPCKVCAAKFASIPIKDITELLNPVAPHLCNVVRRAHPESLARR